MGEVNAAIDHTDLYPTTGGLRLGGSGFDRTHVPLAGRKRIRSAYARVGRTAACLSGSFIDDGRQCGYNRNKGRQNGNQASQHKQSSVSHGGCLLFG